MPDIIERVGDRIYTNRLPPCGHSNGTHPSGCWWPATSEMIGEAVAAERERIRVGVWNYIRTTEKAWYGVDEKSIDAENALAAILRIVEDKP
jgi:hypothetical protein